MVGNAFCMQDDIDRARVLFPNAPVIAVNGASREVKALALFSYHPERFIEKGCEWIRHQRRRFGPGFTVHASKYVPGCPHVDHWWEGARGKGGSAWGARKLASLMGFGPVILCGCPLVPGNYANHRPGMIMTRAEVVGAYAFEIKADADWHEGCYSMSGATKEILGAPC
ncbi:MAG: hypothetical protein NUV72_05070 [Bauldia sp.]|nr:hypothetical protein [Bauldia sp.]